MSKPYGPFEYGDRVRVGARLRRALVMSRDKLGPRDGYSVRFDNGEQGWVPAPLVVADNAPKLFEERT